MMHFEICRALPLGSAITPLESNGPISAAEIDARESRVPLVGAAGGVGEPAFESLYAPNINATLMMTIRSDRAKLREFFFPSVMGVIIPYAVRIDQTNNGVKS